MSYRGESPAKKIVRLKLWKYIQRRLGRKFKGGAHLALAGPEAGDLSVLLGLEVPIQNVVLADIDKHAVDAALWKFPGADVHRKDVLDTAEQHPTKFISAYLDFCGPVSEKRLSMVHKIGTQHLQKGGVIACTFLIGRERGAIWKEIEAYSGSAQARRMKFIADRFSKDTKPLRTLRCFHYCSHTNERYGKSMLVWVGTASSRSGKPVQVEEIQADRTDLAEEALKLGHRAPLLLNVTKQSIAAWKAHYTRGTYG